MKNNRAPNLELIASSLAHEMNNPIAYLLSNLQSLVRYEERIEKYLKAVFDLTDSFEAGRELVTKDQISGLNTLRRDLKLDFLIGDLGELIKQSQHGVGCLQNIIQSLRLYARRDAELRSIDVREIVESVLTLIHGELKHRFTYGKILDPVGMVKLPASAFTRALTGLLLRLTALVHEQGLLHIQTSETEAFVRIVMTIENQDSAVPCGEDAAWKEALEEACEPLQQWGEVTWEQKTAHLITCELRLVK
jgi:two-component system, NtrC family, sensor kinase